MDHTPTQLRSIYNKTKGHCAYCGKKLSFINYANYEHRLVWEIDHSIAKAKGGTNYFRNLQPSCVPCNRTKGKTSGTNYKRKFEPKTPGGKIVKALGMKRGSLGSSYRQIKRKK